MKVIPEPPNAGNSTLPARALLGFMDREQATRFLLEDCIFRDPLAFKSAEDIWHAHRAMVEALPPHESPFVNKAPLSAADLKTARKFRSRNPEATSVVDFVRLNPEDLIVHQLWISTAIADRYRDKVTPDRWHRTAFFDSPSDSGLKWRREEATVIFDLPGFEYVLSGPFAPDGTMRPAVALDFVSVAFHAGRALLVSGYHRAFAAVQQARQAASGPRGLLFGVSNFLELMGSEAEEVRRTIEGARPPRMADFFDDRLFAPVALRRRRYQMRIHVEVTALDAEEAQVPESDASNPSATPASPYGNGRIPDINALLEDALRHHRAGRLDEAVEQYKRVLFLKPDHAEANNALGASFAEQKKIAEAVEHYERALALRPDYADAHYNLGRALAVEGKFEDAIAHQRQAVRIDPKHADAYNQLGHALTCQGKFDEAMVHCERAIAIKPDHAEAHFIRAEIRKFRPGDPDLTALERLAASDHLSAAKLTFVHFALAKALEDAADYTRAFEYLQKGNALKRSQVEYDETHVLKGLDRMAGVFDKIVFDRFAGVGDPSSAPIFVLGMPRSGSTLIEQILASHPQVHAGGELHYMRTIANTILNPSGQPALVLNDLLNLDTAILRRAGESYASQLQALAGGKPAIVDKMPGNFFNLGLISLILPNAKIIHTVRDPIDTCVSCYSKLFETGHHYTYDLAELGRFYHRYAKLMDHWRSVLPPGALLEVVYEDVVGDLEGQARRLIDYCGLSWDDRCLDFHRTNRTVSTLSNFQVRQPLFRTSVQRWRRYEAQVGPLLTELGDLTQGHTSARA